MNKIICIATVLFVLCSSAFAQSAGWQSVAPPISPQIDETPHCRIHVADGSTGSGTLVCRGARSGYVVTCSHLFSTSQAGIVCQFPNGQQFGGTLAVLDKANDLAVVQIAPRPAFAGAPLADAQPPTGIIACGFGPDGQFQARGGTVEREEDAQGAQFHHFIATASVRPGDSGGAVLDSQGRITGVVWGCRDNEVRFFAGAPFFRIISDASGGYGKVQLAQCQGGRCYGGQCYGGNCGPGAYGPGMVTGPIYQPQPSRPTRPVETEQQPAYQNPPSLQPTTPPMPTAQPCPCGPKWQDLETKLNQLTATLEAQQKFNTEITATVKEQNQALTNIKNDVATTINQKFETYVQQHPTPTGPTAAEVAALGGRLTKIEVDITNIKNQKPPAPTAPPEPEQHVVVIADHNAEYWTKLAEVMAKTAKTYKGVQESPLPEFPIGIHPQAVVYQNGVPVRIAKGLNEVEVLLTRLSRGDPI